MEREPQPLPLFTDKPLPQALDCERAILSCLLSDAEESVDEVIRCLPTVECFYTAEHRIIYGAIMELRQTLRPSQIDFVLICDALEKQGLMAKIGGTNIMAYLLHYAPASGNLRSYIEPVQQAWALRLVIIEGTRIVRNCFDAPKDVWRFIQDAEGTLEGIQNRVLESSSQSMADVTDELMQHCKSATNRKAALFHMGALDRTLYLPEDSYVVVGARPSVGKTAFALSCICNAMSTKTPVGFISMEMPHINIQARLMAMRSHLSYREIMEGERVWDDVLRQKVHMAARNIRDYPVYFDGEGRSMTMAQITQTCRSWVRNHGVRQIFIDYFQIIDVSGKGSRYERFCDASMQFLALKNELKVPIFLLAQLGREFDSDRRRSKHAIRPTRSYLKETGSLEQDADMIILLDRPNLMNGAAGEVVHDYYDDKGVLADMEHSVAVVVDKNRNGELTTKICNFNEKRAQII
jgi:replicative DNA helicase